MVYSTSSGRACSYILFSPVLYHNLLGAFCRAGVGKVADRLVVLTDNIDNLVVVLMRQTVGLNPDYIGVANEVGIWRCFPPEETDLWELLPDFPQPGVMATEHNDAMLGFIRELNCGIWCVVLVLPVLLVKHNLPETGKLLCVFFSFKLDLPHAT